jgi:hypothetical protein
MFKAIKEFLFGKLPEQKAPEAPYKVETPAPVVVESAPVVEASAPVAEVVATPAPKQGKGKKPQASKPAGSKKPRGPRKPKSSQPKG